MTAPTTIETAIFAALASYSGVNAIVGTRVYEFVAPQDVARPYVAWQEIHNVPTGDLDGTQGTSGLDRCFVQVTAWSASRDQARALALQVRLAMEAYASFKAVAQARRSLPFEPDTKLFGVQADYAVWLRT